MSALSSKITKISRGEFKARRKRILKQLGPEAVLLLPGARTARRNRDVEYPFRQESDFHYLTGFDEPDALAALVPGRESGEFVLFCRPYDPQRALWTGAYAGLDGARKRYGADEAHPIEDVDEFLPALLENRRCVYFPVGEDSAFDLQVYDWTRQVRGKTRAGVRAPTEFISTERLIHPQRLRKSESELALMRHAAAISAEAHCRVMRNCRPGRYEYQLAAEFLHELQRQGLQHCAYPSIVAAGANACVLHYTENTAPLLDGDLLLIDAGGEWQNYAADITRTFPVNGRFTDVQRSVYDLVLAAQSAALAEIRPGNTWNQPHEAAVRVLTEGLKVLGVLKGKIEKLMADEAYKPFYMHRTGHWLGLDVHDVGDYKVDEGWRSFEPGMVLTVEPGLYFSPKEKAAPKWLRGMGVRIEDDVVVTTEGAEVLTGGVPKTPDAIEALMAEGNG